MSVPVVAFFNNKGGVGKTSLVYHLAWMLADLGHRVVAADLDPQANLTSAFLNEETLETLWPESGDRQTVWGAIKPWQEGFGSIGRAPLWEASDERLALLPGDLELSSFEDALSAAWPLSGDRDPRSFRVMAAFATVLTRAVDQHRADIVLLDVGPSLGAINRAALVAATHVVIPMAPDLFSLQGLRNLGPTLRTWREGWKKRLAERPEGIPLSELPAADMNILGYVVLQHGVRLDRPVKAYQRWMDKIPHEFRRSMLNQESLDDIRVSGDPFCLAQLKHYHSLMPLAQEARKPVFALRPADGAFGGHFQAAQSAYVDYRKLAEEVLKRSTHSAG